MRALLIVVASACCACASTGATPRPFPMPGGAATESRSPAPAKADNGPASLPIRASGYEISGTALSLRGKPYRSGGADPNGFDCSGLVKYVFSQYGFALPRTVAEQYRIGGEVSVPDLLPGDLVFFSTTTAGPSHVGILVGGDSFVHAPTTSGTVRVDSLGATYWSTRYLGARRIN